MLRGAGTQVLANPQAPQTASVGRTGCMRSCQRTNKPPTAARPVRTELPSGDGRLLRASSPERAGPAPSLRPSVGCHSHDWRLVLGTHSQEANFDFSLCASGSALDRRRFHHTLVSAFCPCIGSRFFPKATGVLSVVVGAFQKVEDAREMAKHSCSVCRGRIRAPSTSDHSLPSLSRS